ncbi:17744_t:CDS:2 [Rhizophagus irregularis]|nr:17744_t:CDS:2 [Rhizophagus irregularis]
MVKSKRSKFPISGSISSLDEFPVELLLLIFKELDIPTLLKVCNVCKRFQQISSKMLFNKFKEPNVGILLTFEQEYKWKSYIHFEISKYNEQTGKFIFKPRSKQPMRFINSPMVRNPILSKISISVNLLQKPLSLNIKSHEETINKVQHVYRIGHGTSHLRIPYRFIYSITDTPPPSVNKTRGGERWLTPISFECSPSFFYPSEPIAHKIIMTIIHLRKRNLHKKKSPSSSINKQKQRMIDFDEVLEDDYISIEFMNDNNMRNRRLLERQMSHQEQQDDHHSSYFRRKFKWGARS